MAIELPRAGPSSTATGGRIRTVRQPTAADVPTVSVTADPGLTIPNLAQFETGLSDIGAAMSDTSDRLAAAGKRLDERRESVERIRAGTVFSAFAADTMQEFSSTRDFSRQEITEEFGATLRGNIEEIVEAHDGSEESKLRLRERLEPIFSMYADRAATRSVKAQDALVTDAFDGIFNSLTARVRTGEDPFLLIDEGLAHIEAEKDSLRPGQEISFTRTLSANVFGAKLDDLMSKSAFEEAEELLGVPEVQSAIGAKAQATYFDRIDASRREQKVGRFLSAEDLTAAGFAEGTVARENPDGTVEVLQTPGDSDGTGKILTAEELESAGIRKGAVIALNDNGNYQVLQAPPADDDGDAKLLTSAEAKAAGFPEGFVVERSADGKHKVVFKPEGRFRLLTAEQMAESGFDEGSIVQEGPDGKLEALHIPPSDEDQTVLLTPAEIKAAGLDEGTVAERAADGSHTVLFSPTGDTVLLSDEDKVATGFDVDDVVERGPDGSHKVLVRAPGKQQTLSGPEVKALGFPSDVIVQRAPDGALNVIFKSTPASERDKKIAGLVGRGVEPDVAADLVDGNIFFNVVPSTGRVRMVDAVNGTATEIPLTGQAQADQPPPERSLMDIAASGAIAGVVPFAMELFSETFGQIPGVPVAEQMIESRQELKAAQNSLIRALSINRRFPVGEIDRIRDEIKIAPKLFDSQRALIARMRGIDHDLRIRLEDELSIAADPNLAEKDRNDAAKAARDISNFLRRLGADTFDDATLPPVGVPEFSTHVGTTAEGNDVWRSPDGKSWVVE